MRDTTGTPLRSRKAVVNRQATRTRKAGTTSDDGGDEDGEDTASSPPASGAAGGGDRDGSAVADGDGASVGSLVSISRAVDEGQQGVDEEFRERRREMGRYASGRAAAAMRREV